MRKDTCFYFNGLANATCEANINYRDISGVSGGPIVNRLPCFTKNDMHQCSVFRLPSKEELDQFEKEIERVANMHRMAAPLVLEFKREYKGRSGKVIKTCPVCGGNLHMSIAAYNGHVWGKCETDNCLNWME